MAKLGNRPPARETFSLKLNRDEKKLIDRAAYETRARSRGEYIRRAVLQDATRVVRRAEKAAAQTGAAA